MPAEQALVVAIDGPSGSGKSSVSRAVAERLRLAYLDTGAMYRAATVWCLRRGVDLSDTTAVAAQVRALPLVMVMDPAAPAVLLDGQDVTAEIRDSSVSTAVSAVATNLAARAELGRRQRELITAETGPDGWSRGRGVVAEGRDITTVVAPDATVRVLLTADEGTRLARRAMEVHGAADADAVAATRVEVLERDAKDSAVVEFHRAGHGVVTVDSSALDLDQTVTAVLDVVGAVVGSAPGTDEP